MDHDPHHAHATSAAAPEGMLHVRLFAGMAATAGRRSVALRWDGGNAALLRSRLAAELPDLAPLLARSAVAIGDAYVADDTPVPVGADVAVIPPVSGG